MADLAPKYAWMNGAVIPWDRCVVHGRSAGGLGVQVVEREIDRTELYVADEVFMCGSGLEVLPVISVDRIPVGEGIRGSMTKRIQDVYFAAARGELPAYRHWLTPVYSAAREPAVTR
jgi:hypothetical protein